MINRLRRLISRYWIAFALVAVFVGGFAVRLYKINNPVADWHSWRQADTASVSWIYVTDGIDLLHPRYHDISVIQTGYYNPNGWRFVEFPLYNAIHAKLYTSFPSINFEVWGRLVSIFSALITAFALFKLVSGQLNKRAGMFAAFFYLFIPFNIYFTRVILPDPMGTMWITLSLWMFFAFYRSEKNYQLYLSAAFFALAMLVKPFAIFYTIPILVAVYKKWGIKKVFKSIPFLLALDIALVPFFAWRAWMNNFIVGIPHFAWMFNGDGIRFRPSFWYWIFGQRLGRLVLGDWGLVPFTFGLLASLKKHPFLAATLFGMFLYVSTIATASVRHDYYQTYLIPAVAWALAVGADYLWETKEYGKYAGKILLGFCVFMMLLMGWYQARDYYIVNHYEIVLAGQAVDRLTPKDARIIAPYNGDTAFLYQTRRWGWPIVDRDITELIAQGAKYYVSVNKGDTDTQNFKKRFVTVEETDRYIILDLSKKL